MNFGTFRDRRPGQIFGEGTTEDQTSTSQQQLTQSKSLWPWKGQNNNYLQPGCRSPACLQLSTSTSCYLLLAWHAMVPMPMPMPMPKSTGGYVLLLCLWHMDMVELAKYMGEKHFSSFFEKTCKQLCSCGPSGLGRCGDAMTISL